MKKSVVVVILALSLVALFAVSAAPALATTPLSPGYWMNHPDAWPAAYTDSITIGGVTYLKADAIAWMKAPTRRDMSVAMFQALAAAKLNFANGSGSYPFFAIAPADAWMCIHAPGTHVAASSADWQGIPQGDAAYWYWALGTWWDAFE